jgi:alpha-NAC-related protein
MQQLMRQMGMKQKEIPALRVIIETDEGNLVFTSPSVTETQIQGQSTFQIMGTYTMQSIETEPVIPDEKSNCKLPGWCIKGQAREALVRSKGDLAQAIMDLQIRTPTEPATMAAIGDGKRKKVFVSPASLSVPAS